MVVLKTTAHLKPRRVVPAPGKGYELFHRQVGHAVDPIPPGAALFFVDWRCGDGETKEMRWAVGGLHRPSVAAGLTNRPVVACPGTFVATNIAVFDIVHAVSWLVDDHGIVRRPEVIALDRQCLRHAF